LVSGSFVIVQGHRIPDQMIRPFFGHVASSLNLVGASIDFDISQRDWQSWEILFNHGGDNLSYALFFWAFNANDGGFSLFSLFVKDTGVMVPGKPQQLFFSRSQFAGDFSVPARTLAGISPAGMSETIFDGVWPDGLSGCSWCLSFGW